MRPADRAGVMLRGSRRSILAACLLGLLTTGCAVRGPEAMRTSRLAYNEAVQVSEQRELLLNLVRLRYTESPEFLAIGGISTQMRFEAEAAIGGEFGEEGDDSIALVRPGASFGYSESPTVTFVPRRDKEFTRQLVAPVELDSIYLLTRYGWGIDRVLRLVVDDLNGWSNAVSREADPGTSADVKTFSELVSKLRTLEARRKVRVAVERRREILSAPIPAEHLLPEDVLDAIGQGYRLDRAESGDGFVLTGERQHFVLAVEPEAWNTPELQSLGQSLGLTPGLSRYEIDPADGPDTGGLRLTTRSVLGAMAYLSQGVSVPPEHGDGVAASGKEGGLPDGLLNVRVSGKPADDAYLAVPYRGYWFHVADSDEDSKRTLGLLNSLVRLSIGAGGAQNVPVLTLPVGR